MIDYPHISPSGDSAVTIVFGNKIDDRSNGYVYALKRILESESSLSILSIIPSYSSLLVVYDINKHGQGEITDYIESKLSTVYKSSAKQVKKEIVEIPTVYGGEYGPDLDYVAEHVGLTRDEVIKIHSSVKYKVYMIGFSPGFPYLGGMEKKISCHRLQKPRLRIPQGSVGIAGDQTGVYPSESPGGWRLIGRTPKKLFNVNCEPPVTILPGSYVKFIPINSDEFNSMTEGSL